MKKSYCILLGLLACLSPIFGQGDADTVTSASEQVPAKIVTINTSVGTLKAKLYDDVPNHVRTFIERAKRGALAAPRQNDDINPQKKSDMSQFYIVQGKVYTSGELDTLEMIANQDIKEKAMQKFFYPVRAELRMQKASNKREYQKRLRKINAQVDSMVRATPGHLLFTKEQRKAYTTEGGCHHLDGNYTVYGELIEGFDVLDIIAGQPRDEYDRPKKDIRIIQLTIEN